MSDMKRTITPNDPADFTPTREPQIPLQPFRYWCQKVLPLVYDDSLSYYELLCKVVDYLNKTMEDVSNMDTDMTNLYSAYNQLQNYVNIYFSSLDVQTEINNKLDNMADTGELSNLLQSFITMPPIQIVSSTSDMTNHSMFYILSTNGHVYTWNGSSFYDTGLVYTANTNTYFQRTVYTANNPYSGDLSDLTNIGFYSFLSGTQQITGLPAGFYANSMELYVLSDCSTGLAGLQIISCHNTDSLAFRFHYNQSWYDWIMLTGDINYGLKGVYTQSNLYTGDLTDLTEIGYYSFLGGQQTITGLPSGFLANSMELYVLSDCSTGLAGLQIISCHNTDSLAFRFHYNQSWYDWITLTGNNDNTYYTKVSQYDANHTYTGDLTDLTTIGYYSFLGGPQTINNLPEGFTANALELYVLGRCDTGFAGLQIIANHNANTMAFRIHYGSTWKEWNVLNSDVDVNTWDNNGIDGLATMIACGDSITVSTSNQRAGVSVNVKSWAKYINEDAVIYAAGGYTTQNFIDNLLATASASSSQYAFIFLGINDINQNVDVDTFKSNYQSIVNSIMNNRKFVLCVSIPYTLQPISSRPDYNAAIQEICNSTDNCFYVDITEYEYLFSSYKNYGHLCSVGYPALAKAITLATNKVLSQNFFLYTLDFES